jgi:hypothetical protein
MNFVRRFTAPLALIALSAGVSTADPGAGSAAPLASRLGLPAELAAIVPAGSPMWRGYGNPAHRNDAIRYRPRAAHAPSPVNESPVQIHAGFFDPDGGGSNSFVLGLRGGPLVDPHIQIGVGMDWVHRSPVVAGTSYVQGGAGVTPQRVLSRASTDLLPFQLFLQLNGNENRRIIPYAGAGGGYQVLFVSAEDYITHTSYDATFGGWGWQAWLGTGIPLSGRSRMTGEVYMNQSSPERDVVAPDGIIYRERVNGDGVGMRFGLAWGF